MKCCLWNTRALEINGRRIGVRERREGRRMCVGQDLERKGIRMKGIWNKSRRNMAAALVASMLVTSAMPITGLAEVYDVNGIFGSEPAYDFSEYLATASVAAKVTGDDKIELASGSDIGEAVLEAAYDIVVNEISQATPNNATPDNATASDADWQVTEADIAEEILKNLTMKATVSDADPAIADYVELDLERLEHDGIAAVRVQIPEDERQALAGGIYQVPVWFIPELDEEMLGGNIEVTSIKPCEFIVAVSIAGDNPEPDEPLAGSVEWKGFNGETDGNTWIYVGDDPVDLNDYCSTDPAGLAVEFASSDPDVAAISGKGILTPLVNGNATVTATIVQEGYKESTAKLKVQVWTYVDMPEVPEAFELNAGETLKFMFKNSLAKDCCILNMNGEKVKKDRAELVISDEFKSVTVIAKKPGSYQLYLKQHVDGQVTYVGTVDFTIMSQFNIGGFNYGEKDDENGVTSTWTYMEYGSRNLRDLCSIDAEEAVVTFVSSDENIAGVDGDYLIPYEKGRVTITATMEAPGCKTVTDTLIVDIWGYEVEAKLPDTVTMHKGETWTYDFAEPLSKKTKIIVFNEETDEVVGEDALKVSVSEDRTVLTLEAKQTGNYYLQTERHREDRYTTYVSSTYISVLEAGVSLEVSVAQIVVEPGETVTFDVAYTPEDADLELSTFDDGIIEAFYEDGKVAVTGIVPTEYAPEKLRIRLVKDGEVLAGEVVMVYVAEKQLEATSVEEVLAEANAKAKDIMKYGSNAEVFKLATEVAAILADAPLNEIIENKDAIDTLEAVLRRRIGLEDDFYSDDIGVEVTGALLNLASKGEYEGKLAVKRVEDAANTAGVTLDIKLRKGSNGGSITELDIPMQLRLKVPGIDLSKKVRIKHTKENGSVNWIYPDVDGEYLVFWVDSYSTFAISNYTTSSHSGGSGGGGGGGSSTSTSVSGTVTNDAKKGYVNSVTGIITGSAAGYSSWNQDESGWKLQYADGTFAAGMMMTDGNGTPYEQVAWDMINGAWNQFGAGGFVKSGFV